MTEENRKLLQENTAKLTAREIIQMIKARYHWDPMRHLIQDIEKRYGL